uniref:Uncharacterized protein n=1 Tax=Fervidicoccus fontis TaxID=683846 RepID=A0A7J3SK71_9CREN
MEEELEMDENLRLNPEEIDEYITELDKEASLEKYSQELAPGEVATNKQTGETYTVESIDTSGVAIVVDQTGTRRKIHKDYLQRPTASRKIAQDFAGTPAIGMGGTPAQAPGATPPTAKAPAEEPEEAPEIEVTEPAIQIPEKTEAPIETPAAPEMGTTISQQFLKEIFTDQRIAPLIVELLIEKLTSGQLAEALPEPVLENMASRGITPQLVKKQGFEIITRLASKLYE